MERLSVRAGVSAGDGTGSREARWLNVRLGMSGVAPTEACVLLSVASAGGSKVEATLAVEGDAALRLAEWFAIWLAKSR